MPCSQLARTVLPWAATHPVCTGLATGLMLSEVSVAGLLGIKESSSNSLQGCAKAGKSPHGHRVLSGAAEPAQPSALPHPAWAALYHRPIPSTPHVLALG